MDLILLLISACYLLYKLWDESRPPKFTYDDSELLVKDLLSGKTHAECAELAKLGRYSKKK